MKILKVHPVWRGAVSPDKQRQEMLDNLDDQITDIFFISCGKSGRGILQEPGEPGAAQADMDAIIGQTDIGQIGQGNKIAGNDPGFTKFQHGVELAAAQHAVTQMHIAIFILASLPPGKTGIHEELPVERIRHGIAQHFLPDRRMRRQKDHRLLTKLLQPVFFIGILDQKLRQQKADGHFPCNRTPRTMIGFRRNDIKRRCFRRRVVVLKILHDPQTGPVERRVPVSSRSDYFRQRKLQKITDRHPDITGPGFIKKKPADIRTLPGVDIGLVRHQILLEGRFGKISQLMPGETHPAVFPDAFRIVVQILLQIGHDFSGGIAGFGPPLCIGKVVGLLDNERQIYVVFISGNHRLQFRFTAGGRVRGRKRQRSGIQSQPVVLHLQDFRQRMVPPGRPVSFLCRKALQNIADSTHDLSPFISCLPRLRRKDNGSMLQYYEGIKIL